MFNLCSGMCIPDVVNFQKVTDVDEAERCFESQAPAHGKLLDFLAAIAYSTCPGH